MRRADALELLLPPADEARVLAAWGALRGAGIPSQGDRTGGSHRPHVTLCAGPSVPADRRPALAAGATRWLGDRWAAAGLTVLGGRRPLVVLRLDPPPGVRAWQQEAVSRWPGADAPPWVPHLTLSRPLGPHHLGTEAVAEALCAVGEVVAPHLPPDVGGSALRWWDPGAGTASVLAGRA